MYHADLGLLCSNLAGGPLRIIWSLLVYFVFTVPFNHEADETDGLEEAKRIM